MDKYNRISYPELRGQGFVGLAQFCVGAIEVVDLDFEFSVFRFVLLLQTTVLALVLVLDLQNVSLHLLNCSLTVPPAKTTTRPPVKSSLVSYSVTVALD